MVRDNKGGDEGITSRPSAPDACDEQIIDRKVRGETAAIKIIDGGTITNRALQPLPHWKKRRS
jgi:hypothetical protein